MASQRAQTRVNPEVGKEKIFAGALCTPRSFLRRVAWQTIDHLWEIEDRIA
jgi:hypothetical protein